MGNSVVCNGVLWHTINSSKNNMFSWYEYKMEKDILKFGS